MKRFAFIATALLLPAYVGCGGGDNSVADSQSKTNTTQSQPLVVDGVGTEPAQTVGVFLDSLRRGDETAANSVLTSRARAELGKTAYQIQPLGTPDGKYTIGRVGFPYEDKTVALVECQWTEPAAPGEAPIVMDIVCEVHQEADGWRIAGLGVKLDGSEDTLVLDFEDASSLQATIQAATGTPAQTTPATEATGQFQPQQVPNNLTVQPSSLGSLPPLPNSETQPAGYQQTQQPAGYQPTQPAPAGYQPTQPAPAGQLAFPPLNMPVQR